MGEPNARDLVVHAGDPAALEVLQIRNWAEELASIANSWLNQREVYRAHQAQQANARQAAAHQTITDEIRSTR